MNKIFLNEKQEEKIYQKPFVAIETRSVCLSMNCTTPGVRYATIQLIIILKIKKVVEKLANKCTSSKQQHQQQPIKSNNYSRIKSFFFLNTYKI